MAESPRMHDLQYLSEWGFIPLLHSKECKGRFLLELVDSAAVSEVWICVSVVLLTLLSWCTVAAEAPAITFVVNAAITGNGQASMAHVCPFHQRIPETSTILSFIAHCLALCPVASCCPRDPENMSVRLL